MRLEEPVAAWGRQDHSRPERMLGLHVASAGALKMRYVLSMTSQLCSFAAQANSCLVTSGISLPPLQCHTSPQRLFRGGMVSCCRKALAVIPRMRSAQD